MFLSIVLASSFVGLSADMPLKAREEGARVLEFPIKKVYLPSGFDSNDYPEVLIEGEFPSQCYEFDHSRARFVDGVIYFRVYAKQYEGPCAQVTVPFLEVAKLDKPLEEGVYDVVHLYKDSEKIKGQLSIRYTESKSRDDFTYAHVDSSAIQVNPDTGERFLTLFGNQTNSCHDFDMERTSMRVTAKGFVEVRPILKEIQPADICLQIWKKYSKSIPLPENFPQGRHAFYIRKGEGGSFHKLDEIPHAE